MEKELPRRRRKRTKPSSPNGWQALTEGEATPASPQSLHGHEWIEVKPYKKSDKGWFAAGDGGIGGGDSGGAGGGSGGSAGDGGDG